MCLTVRVVRVPHGGVVVIVFASPIVVWHVKGIDVLLFGVALAGVEPRRLCVFP
jgi:hypothetical protein